MDMSCKRQRDLVHNRPRPSIGISPCSIIAFSLRTHDLWHRWFSAFSSSTSNREQVAIKKPCIERYISNALLISIPVLHVWAHSSLIRKSRACSVPSRVGILYLNSYHVRPFLTSLAKIVYKRKGEICNYNGGNYWCLVERCIHNLIQNV